MLMVNYGNIVAQECFKINQIFREHHPVHYSRYVGQISLQ